MGWVGRGQVFGKKTNSSIGFAAAPKGKPTDGRKNEKRGAVHANSW